MTRNKKKVTWYYDLDQLDALDALSAETRVPKAVLVRLAIKQYLRFIDDQRSTTKLLSLGDEPEGKTLAEVFADEETDRRAPDDKDEIPSGALAAGAKGVTPQPVSP